jgi:DNA-binding GntR family transcriptional regulator
VILRRDADGARKLMYEHIGAAIAMISEAMAQRDGQPAGVKA